MSFRSISVRRALNHVSRNDYVLPAIQREFVWSSDQICRLFDSLLRDYPIGTFLFWNVPPELSREFRFYGFMREYHELKARHSESVHVTDPRTVTAVLDGQQRLTALHLGLLGYLATRKKYGRANNPSAYPKRHLYLDVEFDPEEHDEESLYRFEFFTASDASRTDRVGTWFRVSDILDLQEGAGIFRWVQANGLAEHPSAFPILDRLWRAVHTREAISYFEDESSSIDRVLEIFIRTNSGGTVLSKSDLLLSVATAQFTQLDARSAVHGLVDDLNAVGQGFSFTKDNVLKAALMIADRLDIRFRVDAFTSENVAELENQWDRIDQALRVTAQLLASFGFSDRTLSAGSVLLPVADYVAFRNVGPQYVNQASERGDRERVRQWVTRTLLKQGIWGSGLDTLLTRLRRAIREEGASAFPVERLEREMAALGKSSVLSSSELEELVETPIGNRRAFPLLALLYPGVDVRNEFHIDHVFPRSMFTSRRLSQAGIDGDLHDEFQDLRDRLPNLQLLEGAVNVSKQATQPAVWVAEHQPDPVAREGWLAAHDLVGLPEDLAGFLDFYERRREIMLDRLRRLVGDRGDQHEVGRAEINEHMEPSSTPFTPQRTAPAEPRPSPAPRGRRTFARSLSELRDGPISYTHRGLVHRAYVRNGEIRFEDGSRFDSPTAAARALNGDVSVNGWRVWVRDGRSIGDIVDRDR